ncbi:MAG TPA: DUF6541 family protein, partial [Marmoricola sp.]|nr:DUF6541 family protein [Marmoricola sp.]
MTSWLAVLPEIAFMVAILGLPGLLVARCLQFRWWDAIALSTPLSLAVLALANIASILTGMRWGLLVVVLATVGTVLACVLVMRTLGPVVARSSLGQAHVEGRRVIGVMWDRRAEVIAILATVAAAIVGAIAIARGTGTPHTLNQTSDAAFHVNSISAVAQQHRASPSMLSNLGYPFGSGGFYPPTFAAAVSLLVTYAHVSPVVAANVSSVAIAILWPLTVSIAVRRLARPSAFGYLVAMVGAVTVSLFPAVLLAWGTVWPNALSVLALAPALVMV